MRRVADVILPRRTANLKQFGDLLESDQRNSSMYACARDPSRIWISKGRAEAAHSRADSGYFRRPVVRSDGADRRPAGAPRLAPFPAAERVAVRASPYPTRDAFSIGDSKRKSKQEYGVVTLRCTRLHGPDTPSTNTNYNPPGNLLTAKQISYRVIDLRIGLTHRG